MKLCSKEVLVLGKNAVEKATKEALCGSRQIEVRYVDIMDTTLALAYLLALVFTKLVSLPAKEDRRLNQVFRSMTWGNESNRTVVITFTNKFDVRNVELFSQKLARAIEYIAVVKTSAETTAKHIPKGKKPCKK